MTNTDYAFEKRQRDLAKKKKDEKRLKKKEGQGENASQEDPPKPSED